MTRLVDEETGEVIPVTLVELKKNTVSGFKTAERDGYNALVLGFEKKKSKAAPFKNLLEFKVDDVAEFSKDQEIALSIFEEGQTVSVQGISKGRGFQGVIKRHNFHRGPMSHGSDHHREPGSVGTRKPRRIKLGKKLPGRMGNDKVTLQKVRIV
ncbi:MAG: 50S ribosomal protein L3, partial [Candidatus Gracilibacteria bacterium]|nr:50S ribosomal protein L3 [Candidatus Gracilibacteria bacterium]